MESFWDEALANFQRVAEGQVRSDPRITVFLERRVGGRIYERTPEGVEHEWGEVTVWDPPGHFAYH